MNQIKCKNCGKKVYVGDDGRIESHGRARVDRGATWTCPASGEYVK